MMLSVGSELSPEMKLTPGMVSDAEFDHKACIIVLRQAQGGQRTPMENSGKGLFYISSGCSPPIVGMFIHF